MSICPASPQGAFGNLMSAAIQAGLGDSDVKFWPQALIADLAMLSG
jgi:hypothetical protein